MLLDIYVSLLLIFSWIMGKLGISSSFLIGAKWQRYIRMMCFEVFGLVKKIGLWDFLYYSCF